MSEILVSIVLPTYNGSMFIRTAIESCLNQTYARFELLVVNDASTDNTLEIINEYAATDERVKVIVNETNKKLPASLNAGFSKASGQFFTWISDDNIFGPKAIETMVGELKSNPETDIVYSSYFFIDESGRRLDTFGEVPENLLFKCAPGACFLYKRQVHETLNGFDEGKFRMEDFDFWLRAATKFRYRFIDRSELYFYRKHPNNLTSAIFSNKDLYKQYRDHHLTSFRYFFQEGLHYAISDEELDIHLELYFEDLIQNKNWDFSISSKVITYVTYLETLESLDWTKVEFEPDVVKKLIADKKERMIQVVINDLVFENKRLQKKNPRLAAQLNKPISWYYQEYETLPGWYKKVGHIIKALQKNKSWRSLISN